ncbi:hypothetical protein FPV67DRAFT_1415766 [Lyophyllum atratum]|nr:hypothetical protein FPV67DRAFT_1415766 [Lyophyllum atratum]
MAGCQGRDWEYFELNPQCAVRFLDQGNGSFHAIVLATEVQAPAIFNMQYMEECASATGDVLVPHPTKRDHWRVLGRIDDQIMLCTGEVVRLYIQYVTAAVIFGRSRVCLGVLIELNKPLEVTDASAVETARNLVWPSIQLLNSASPPYCRISREMIIFVQIGKPLAYNPKGSPKRPAILLQYQHEIDNCYKDTEDLLLTDTAVTNNHDTCNTICMSYEGQFVRTTEKMTSQ